MRLPFPAASTGALCSVLLASSSAVAATLGPPEPISVGLSPMQAAAFDFNGDPYPDLVTASQASEGVSLLLNAAGDLGVFTEIPAGGPARRVAAGDLDGDDVSDLVVGYAGAAAHIGVIRNLEHGAFAPAVPYGTFGFPDGILLHDVDADEDLDVIVGDASSNTVRVYRNQGDGTMGEAEVYTILSMGAYPSDYAGADLDGDERLDVIVAAPLSSSPALWLRGRSDGTFDDPLPLPTSPGGATSVAAGDLDHDGDVDLVFVDISFVDEIRILFNLGEATWSEAVGISPDFSLSLGARVRLADLDGDDDLDLVAIPLSAGFTPGRAAVFLNDGSGGFLAAASVTTGGYGISLLLEDLDVDGAPDVLVTDHVDDLVWILRNTTSTGAPVAAPAGAGLAVAGANPTRGATAFRFLAPAGVSARLLVADVSGRAVRTLVEGRSSGESRVVPWDGRDDRGRPLPAGVYFVRLEAAGRREATKVTLLR